MDGSILPKVHTLYLNKNRIENVRLLIVNLANTFPNLKHLSLLFNPFSPVNDGPEYENIRLFIIYKLPFLKTLDSREITREEMQKAEKWAIMQRNEERKKKEIKENPKNFVKQDHQQAKLVEEAKKGIIAKKDLLAKNRSISERYLKGKFSGGSEKTGNVGAPVGLKKAGSNNNNNNNDNNNNNLSEEEGHVSESVDEDSSCLIGQSDDSSEVSLEVKSTNYPMIRSISLSGRNLENEFQYSKPQIKGKMVDREGYLTMRIKKTKWKRYWFVLKGGALFSYKSPNDFDYIEQIVLNGALVSKSENRRGNCFKVEKEGEKIVFQCDDAWDVATWIIQIERWTEAGTGAAASAKTSFSCDVSAEASEEDYEIDGRKSSSKKKKDKKKRWSLKK
jgi:hypothetical protein